jgi:hypothetical protein
MNSLVKEDGKIQEFSLFGGTSHWLMLPWLPGYVILNILLPLAAK